MEKTNCGGTDPKDWYDLSVPKFGGLGSISLEKCIFECKSRKNSKYVLFGRHERGWPCDKEDRNLCKCYCSLSGCDKTSPNDAFDMYTVV